MNTNPLATIYEIIHRPTGHVGLVFLSMKELYELGDLSLVCAYLDVSGQIVPQDVPFSEIEIKEQIC